MVDGLKVGEVAKRAEVNLQTIRYYERRGLLSKPIRTTSNYRIYSDDAVRRVVFIKRAQELGFTLKEIGELLCFRATPRLQCHHVRKRADVKLHNIEDKIQGLQAIRRALARLIRSCPGRAPITDCPILEALSSDKGSRK